MADWGDITYYVHEKRGVPLIVTTTTSVERSPSCARWRTTAIPRSDARANRQDVADYLIEERTILWWVGLGFHRHNRLPAPQTRASPRRAAAPSR
jgi:hypothetical protein